jgi:hypothetical protein
MGGSIVRLGLYLTQASILKATALWLAILVLAMLNGTLREKWLVPSLGSFSALVLSGILLSACIFLVALAAAPWYGQLSSAQWLGVGALWLAMTLAFEFGFGRYVQHKAWSELLEAYAFKGGNLWPLVLAVVLISPWLAAKLRGLVG